MRVSSVLASVLLLLCACGSGAPSAASPDGDVSLPGVDTHEFTARERHEFSQYVGQLQAPCKDVAVSVGQCVSERRACDACLRAAQAIAKADTSDQRPDAYPIP